jgi:hypothetical protein
MKAALMKAAAEGVAGHELGNIYYLGSAGNIVLA